MIVILTLEIGTQLWPTLRDDLAYQRLLILNGEWFRLLSAGLTHTNLYHALLNLGALFIISQTYPKQTEGWKSVAILMYLIATSSLLVLTLYPNIDWFVGISGALHGFLIWLAINDWKQHRWLNSTVIAVVIAKVVWEQFFGGSSATSGLIGARVLIEGHMAGAICALVSAPLAVLFLRNSPEK
ncbi:rhombosortase [Corallincola platygyrae]|uniref:Rhombosortase n=1 Tax=Corallincola platygyrae TaxID=1193278 RepID=A0ABW4XJ68_9GAMM